jgi:hypothetical protein
MTRPTISTARRCAATAAGRRAVALASFTAVLAGCRGAGPDRELTEDTDAGQGLSAPDAVAVRDAQVERFHEACLGDGGPPLASGDEFVGDCVFGLVHAVESVVAAEPAAGGDVEEQLTQLRVAADELRLPGAEPPTGLRVRRVFISAVDVLDALREQTGAVHGIDAALLASARASVERVRAGTALDEQPEEVRGYLIEMASLLQTLTHPAGARPPTPGAGPGEPIPTPP